MTEEGTSSFKKQKLQQQYPPQNVGIKAIEIYIPNQCVSQEDLEEYDNVSKGKYTIGLGQTKMGFVNDREDIYSMSLTVLSKLIKNNNIDVNNIGRLEVGTETLIDKSKSVKSYLSSLLGDNHDTEGIDTINACYGGTNALFNALNYVESQYWDGRDCIVVCGDIAIYEKGAARPTGGAGTVAMLIGANAPIVFDHVRGNYMENAYDFYKPDFTSEYPVVDGHYSLSCYVKALDFAYKSYSEKAIKKGLVENPISADCAGVLNHFDYNIFHVPTCKLVNKSYARLLYNDFRNDTTGTVLPELNPEFRELSLEDSLKNKDLEKHSVKLAKPFFDERVASSLTGPTNIGNMYTGSVYSSLCSLLEFVGNDKLQGKRVGMFSYGSGLAASLFSFQVKGDLTNIISNLKLGEKLNKREIATPKEYEAAIELREQLHLKKDVEPKGSIEHLTSGAYYLTKIDDKWRREYAIKE
ncbi:hypothetical protein QEN19_003546 [Hanseniaspora menglaensis]